MGGFPIYGSNAVSSYVSRHGYFLAESLNILRPNLLFECATLSLD